MISSDNISSTNEEIPGFSNYRLNSHLVLNALNQLGMEAYSLTGKEIPLIGFLADYIIAEHETALIARQDAAVGHLLRQEWILCKALLLLKASFADLQLSFREVGDLAVAYRPDHGLAEIMLTIFSAWPDIGGREVQVVLDARKAGVVRVTCFLKKMAGATEIAPFAAGALASLMRANGSPVQRARISFDIGDSWELIVEATR